MGERREQGGGRGKEWKTGPRRSGGHRIDRLGDRRATCRRADGGGRAGATRVGNAPTTCGSKVQVQSDHLLRRAATSPPLLAPSNQPNGVRLTDVIKETNYHTGVISHTGEPPALSRDLYKQVCVEPGHATLACLSADNPALQSQPGSLAQTVAHLWERLLRAMQGSTGFLFPLKLHQNRPKQAHDEPNTPLQ